MSATEGQGGPGNSLRGGGVNKILVVGRLSKFQPAACLILDGVAIGRRALDDEPLAALASDGALRDNTRDGVAMGRRALEDEPLVSLASDGELRDNARLALEMAREACAKYGQRLFVEGGRVVRARQPIC